MNNKYKEAMNCVHHSDELSQRLMDTENMGKKRFSIHSKTGLIAVIVILIMSTATTVFAFSSESPFFSSLRKSESNNTVQSVTENSNKDTKSNNSSKVEKKEYYTLELDESSDVLALASSEKYTVLVMTKDGEPYIQIYNHIKNELRAQKPIENGSNNEPYSLSVDEKGKVGLVGFDNEGNSIHFVFDKRLNLVSDENEEDFEKESAEFDYIDDNEAGTIYSFDGKYYDTPYHDGFQILARNKNCIAFFQNAQDKSIIRIKDFEKKKQIAKLELEKSAHTKKIESFYFDDNRLSFVINSDGKKRIYIWNYKDKPTDVDMRINELSESELRETIDSIIASFENDYGCKVVINNELSPLYRYAVAKKINLFSQQNNASTLQKEIIIGEFDEEFSISDECIKIDADSLNLELLNEVLINDDEEQSDQEIAETQSAATKY